MHRVAIVVAATIALIACGRRGSLLGRGGGPKVHTAMEACRRFENAGAARDCREVAIEPSLTPNALRVVFTLPSGKRGQVFSFNDVDDYDVGARNIGDLNGASKLHWGNRRSFIYVELHRESPDDEASRVKRLLDGF